MPEDRLLPDRDKLEASGWVFDDTDAITFPAPSQEVHRMGIREHWPAGQRLPVYVRDHGGHVQAALSKFDGAERVEFVPAPTEGAVSPGRLMTVRYAGREFHAFEPDALWLRDRLAVDEEEAK